MSSALAEFYRYPEELILLPAHPELNWQEGYFRFAGTLCYGPSAAASCSDLNRAPDVTLDGVGPGLSFDVAKVIDNFRLEHYPIPSEGSVQALLSSDAVLKLYYYFRSKLGPAFRRKLQRLYLRNWDRLPFPAWPVDTSVEQVLEKLLLVFMQRQNLERIPFIWFWPEGAPGAVMLTHDVETKAGLDLLPSLMAVDDSFGLKSAIQLVPEMRYVLHRDLPRTIRERGYEVNVHGLDHEGNLFSDRETFRTQAVKINRYIREFGAEGFRSNCMYRELDWYEDLNVSYDMSVPNVAHLEPQRGGCCTVFPYFVGKIVELPLTTIQDYSLFHILHDYSIDLWKKQIRLITETHGLVSLLIHPDYVATDKPMSIYKALLAHISELRREEGLWMALPGEVNRWWRQRRAMKLVFQNGDWHIQGEGRERARLAFAHSRNGKIEYSCSAEVASARSRSSLTSERTRSR